MAVLRRGKRIAFSAGHGLGSREAGETDSGAVGNSRIEASMNKGWCWRMSQDFARLGWRVLNRDTGVYSDADNVANDWNASVFVEFHWDAGPDGARGCSALVGSAATSAEKSLGAKLCQANAGGIPTQNDGVKTRTDLAVLHQYPNMDSVLFEQGFITDKADVAGFAKNADAIELRQVNAILRNYGLKEVTSLPRTWSNLKAFLYRIRTL